MLFIVLVAATMPDAAILAVDVGTHPIEAYAMLTHNHWFLLNKNS